MINFLKIILISFLCSCGVYSFSGASISPGVKTVSVKNFLNNSISIQPKLNTLITEELKEKLLSETNLEILSSNGDLQFEGEIIGYSTKPIAIQANETAAQNRLTITVNVKFVNLIDESNNFSKSFSHFVDFDSSLNLSDIEDELNNQIIDVLCENIFNNALANW